MKTDAERQSERRRRKACGIRQLKLGVRFRALVDKMVDVGLLQEWDDDDEDAVTAVLERVIDGWIDDPASRRDGPF